MLRPKSTTAGSLELAAKTTLVDADEIPLFDSADSGRKKKSALTNLWTSFIKPKADALYVALTGAQTIAGTKTFSAPINSSPGTAALPSYTFTGDTDTGVWSPSANTVAISTNGTEKMRVAGTGNIGIGTTNPLNNLVVNGSDSAQIGISINNQNASGYSAFRIGTETVAAVGLAIHQFNPSFTSNGGTYSANNATISAFESGGLVLHSQSAAMRFFVGGSNSNHERMRILSSGNVGIGTTTPSERLDVTGNIKASGSLTSGIYTVATLPAVATFPHARAFVSDANATLTAGIGAAVSAGGSNIVPVHSDGTTWRIG